MEGIWLSKERSPCVTISVALLVNRLDPNRRWCRGQMGVNVMDYIWIVHAQNCALNASSWRLNIKGGIIVIKIKISMYDPTILGSMRAIWILCRIVMLVDFCDPNRNIILSGRIIALQSNNFSLNYTWFYLFMIFHYLFTYTHSHICL